MQGVLDLADKEQGRYLGHDHQGLCFGFVAQQPCELQLGSKLSGNFKQTGSCCITSQNGEQVNATIELVNASQAEGVSWLYSK